MCFQQKKITIFFHNIFNVSMEAKHLSVLESLVNLLDDLSIGGLSLTTLASLLDLSLVY